MAEATWFRDLVEIASGILTVAACVLLLGTIPLAFALRRAARQMRDHLIRAEREFAPLLRDLSSAARDLTAVSSTIRRDVDAVHEAVTDTNDKVREVVRIAQTRVRELDGLLQVAQAEAESVLETAVAAARGVRAGASVLGDLVGVRPPSRSSDAAPRDVAPASGRHRGKTTTFDSGELSDADERWGEVGNGRRGGGPRVRSRREP